MSSPDAALRAFYARASQDAALKAALGTKSETSGDPARVYEGWPDDLTNASAFPRATYFLVSAPTKRTGIYDVRIQVDGWFWPGEGAAAARQQWTDAMIALFDEAHWSDGSTRLYAVVVNAGRDFPSAPNAPLRRQMDIRVKVSPGPEL